MVSMPPQSFGYEDEKSVSFIDSAGKEFISGMAGNDSIISTKDDEAILGGAGRR